jgi:hypothetical protein
MSMSPFWTEFPFLHGWCGYFDERRSVQSLGLLTRQYLSWSASTGMNSNHLGCVDLASILEVHSQHNRLECLCESTKGRVVSHLMFSSPLNPRTV